MVEEWLKVQPTCSLFSLAQQLPVFVPVVENCENKKYVYRNLSVTIKPSNNFISCHVVIKCSITKAKKRDNHTIYFSIVLPIEGPFLSPVTSRCSLNDEICYRTARFNGSLTTC